MSMISSGGEDLGDSLFTAPDDERRLMRALARLGCDRLHGWAITGGVATATHLRVCGDEGFERGLNDLDLVVPSLLAIPDHVATNYLTNHIHPDAKPGRMLLQIVDPDHALRIDIFSPFGNALSRIRRTSLGTCSVAIVSIEDLASRLASLLMDLARDEPVPAKHARDFRRLHQFVDWGRIDEVWRDYRRSWHPATYKSASSLALQLAQARADLLIVPLYSRDVYSACLNCKESGPFRLAAREAVRSVLGYC